MTGWVVPLPREEQVARVCRALCLSRKFETGQGTCAVLCMDQLGDARAKCGHRERVHGDLACKILDTLEGK